MEQGDFIDTGIGKGISSPKELILAHLNRMSLNIFSKAPLPVVSEGRTGQIEKASDSRETFIQAVDFLIGITSPYYDGVMTEKQNQFDEKKLSENKELILASIKSEAWKTATSSDGTGNPVYKYSQEAYTYWKNFLLKEKVVMIDKVSRNYEVYISGKYELYFNLFKELNFLLFRKKWLVIEDYTEEENEEHN